MIQLLALSKRSPFLSGAIPLTWCSPTPTKFDDASATSDDEIEIRTVRGASQREFQRLSSEEVEREFKRLSPEEVAQLTPEEKGEYDRQAHFMREMEDLDQDDDTGAAALRVRYDNDNRGSKRRRVSTPSGEDALLEIVEQMKKAAEGGNARAAAQEEARQKERAADKKESDEKHEAIMRALLASR